MDKFSPMRWIGRDLREREQHNGLQSPFRRVQRHAVLCPLCCSLSLWDHWSVSMWATAYNVCDSRRERGGWSLMIIYQWSVEYLKRCTIWKVVVYYYFHVDCSYYTILFNTSLTLLQCSLTLCLHPCTADPDRHPESIMSEGNTIKEKIYYQKKMSRHMFLLPYYKNTNCFLCWCHITQTELMGVK